MAGRAVDEKRVNYLRDVLAKGKKVPPGARQEMEQLAEKLASEKLETVPRVITTEPTPEALAALMADNYERAVIACAEADALDMMMGRYNEKGSPNFGIYLAGHAGDPCRIDRRGRPPLLLNSPALSVALIVQPESVRGLFASRAAKGRGVLARFLPSLPTSRLGHRKINPYPVPERHTGKYENVVRWMLQLDIGAGGGPVVVKLSPQAQGMFNEFRKMIEPQLARGGGLAEQSEWAGKLCGAVGRIALVLHSLSAALAGDQAKLLDPVSAQTMTAALAWAPYLIEHERNVAGVVGADRAVGTADRILAWLEKTGATSFSKRDAFTVLRGGDVRQAPDIEPALAILCDLGYLRKAPVEDQGGAGRKPSQDYLVNPLWKRGAEAWATSPAD